MSGARRLIKTTLIAALYYSGLLWLFALVRLRNKAVVLTYHRVLPRPRQRNSFSAAAIVVTPETFEMNMRFISRYLRVTDAARFAQLLESGAPIPARTCLVTFDDGWYDNKEFAFPILQRQRVPAILFVPTDYPDSGHCFWQERLTYLLFRAWQAPEIAPALFRDLNAQHVTSLDEAAARIAVRQIVTDLKKAPRVMVDELIERVSRLLGSGGAAQTAAEDRFLAWSDLDLLARSGVFAIGSHATSHTPLTQLPREAANDELVRSRQVLRQRLDTPAPLLAYPNGDANDAVAESARQAGYGLAFTTRLGLVSAGSDRWQLCRINIFDNVAASPRALLARIVGL